MEREAAAWTELIARHRTAVLRVLIRVLGAGASSAIEDLEQEVWTRLLANDCDALAGLVDAEEASVRAFLCRTALNLARDHLRRTAVRQVVQPVPIEDLAFAADPGEAIDVAYEKDERRRSILEALEEALVPPNVERDRMIFLAHYVDGYTAGEIAGMGVGLNQKGVESTLHRLLNRVRRVLREKAEDAA